MREQSSAIAEKAPPLPVQSGPSGLAWGALGVFAFSWTVPLTRMAILGGLSPSFIAYGRAVVPGLIAIAALRVTRQRLPNGREWAAVAVVAAGAGFGFALLLGLAARTVPASHSAVVIGLLPLATAVLAALRAGERPRAAFWGASAGGAMAVVFFVGLDQGGLGQLGAGDAYLFGAVLTGALAYAEGGLLARTLGAWQTICWALIVALPVTLPLTLASLPGVLRAAPHLTLVTLLSFGYLSLVSMFLGFFPWYRGLAIGPVSRVSQTQLVQPMLSILWAWLVLGERPGPAIYGGTVVVLAAAMLAVRARASHPSADRRRPAG